MRVVAPFLQKLAAVAGTCPAAAGGWSEDGLEFVVRDVAEFSSVLAEHFKGSLATFVRQLFLYGFTKRERGGGGASWAFAHPSFTRDGMDLGKIERKQPQQKKSSPAILPPETTTTTSTSTLEQRMEARLAEMEEKWVARVAHLEAEVNRLQSRWDEELMLRRQRQDEDNAASSKRLHLVSSSSSPPASEQQPTLLDGLLDDLDLFFFPEEFGDDDADDNVGEACRKRFAVLNVIDNNNHNHNSSSKSKDEIELLRRVILAMQSSDFPHDDCPTNDKETTTMMVAPHLLPPAELCPRGLSKLPHIKRFLAASAPATTTDQQILRAIRQVYELCYAKLKE